jgi:hypothetical protein
MIEEALGPSKSASQISGLSTVVLHANGTFHSGGNHLTAQVSQNITKPKRRDLKKSSFFVFIFPGHFPLVPIGVLEAMSYAFPKHPFGNSLWPPLPPKPSPGASPATWP